MRHRSTVCWVIALALAAPAGLRAQPAQPPLKGGKEVLAAFAEVVAAPAKSTARVRVGGKDAALGTVVGADGWVLTKASELKGPAVCVLADGRELPARVVGVHEATDLAMLKVEAAGLPVVEWRDSTE